MKNFSGTCTILNNFKIILNNTKFAVFRYYLGGLIRRHQGNCLPNCAGMYETKKRIFLRQNQVLQDLPCIKMDITETGK